MSRIDVQYSREVAENYLLNFSKNVVLGPFRFPSDEKKEQYVAVQAKAWARILVSIVEASGEQP